MHCLAKRRVTYVDRSLTRLAPAMLQVLRPHEPGKPRLDQLTHSSEHPDLPDKGTRSQRVIDKGCPTFYCRILVKFYVILYLLNHHLLSNHFSTTLCYSE